MMTEKAPDKPAAAITVDELSRSLFGFRRRLPKTVRVMCSRLAAVNDRDLLELFLWTGGCKEWTWTDDTGLEEPAQPLLKTLYNLARDFIRWPDLLGRYWLRAGRLRKQKPGKSRHGEFSRVLYLRTDHTFDQRYGGSTAHAAGVIGGFRESGVKVTISSTDRLAGVSDEEDFFCVTPRYGLGRNIPNFPELAYTDQLFDWVRDRGGSLKPDFVYQRYSQGNFTGPLIAREFDVPFVCEYNGSNIWVARHWGGNPMFHERLLLRVEKAVLMAADLVVVVSDPLRRELISRGIDERRILVNPNGVNPDIYRPDVDGTEIRKKFGMDGKTVVGFVGSFGVWHGAEVLADAFGKLLNDHPEYRKTVRLFLVGDGNALPEVKRRLAKAGIGDAAVFAGAVPQAEAPAYLAACDIFASPHVPNPDGSAFFGSPTKLFEYMAMGRAIVASDLDQIGEILKHGETGWLVNPGDAGDLALGLEKLIVDTALRGRLGANVRNAVEARHTWVIHIRNILEALATCRGNP